MIKKILLFICVFITFNVFGYDLYSQPTSRVIDYSNVLSNTQIQILNNKLNTIFKNESNTEIEVLLIPKLQDGLDLVDLNTKLFNSWKLGDKNLNNGVLITIVTDTNNIRISTGSGLEGALPDSYLGRIMDENQIKIKLVNKDYFNAINIVTESMNSSIIKENFGDIKLTINRNYIIAIIVLVIGILVIGAFIPMGDSVLTFYLIYYLFEILLMILTTAVKIGGGGGSSGGGSSR